ncbi:MAG: polysaccharide biosynthesis tyrosine autokinase, partial [Chloroflexi bacterium]|nr:polysaccharide biosynthesis tyrosine autokinase [Chloroflexota bacterium]
ILGVAALAGLAIAVAIALLVEYLTDRLRDPVRVASVTGLPTVGLLPTGRSSTNLRDPSDAQLAAAHRLLRARLFAAGVQSKCSLLVTSADREEGKSTAAANLASVLPEASYRVILLDANFHHPTLAQLFEVPNQPGFSTLLADPAADVDSALHTTWHDNLLVVPAGPAPSQASALLSAPRLEPVLRELLDRCDILIVDTPPVLDMPDAALLSQQVDGVLFVIDAHRTRGRRAAAAVDLLRSLNAEPLGAVLNRVDQAVRGSISRAAPNVAPALDSQLEVEPEIDDHGVNVPTGMHSASSSDNSAATS